MEDGLSTLSSHNLTAAVKSLLQTPLPESQFIKSKPCSNRESVVTTRTVSCTKEQSQSQVKESHYIQALPIYQTVNQNDQHVATNQQSPGNNIVQQITLQPALQVNEDRGQSSSLNHKRKFSNDNLQLHQITSENDRSESVVSQSVPHLAGGYANIQGTGINTVVKQPLNNVPIQHVAALIGQRNNLLLPNAQVQVGVNQANGLGLIHNVIGQGVGLSLLQQLFNSQNASSSLSMGGLPVTGQLPAQVSVSELPTESPFSQLSPTQPLQNLIQNLFSNPESSNPHLPTQNTEENCHANSTTYSTFESNNDSYVPEIKQKVGGISTILKDQENTYTTHINLLLEAISKNKTLSPQQFSQIQRSIYGNNESHDRTPNNSEPDHVQAHMLQGHGHIEMVQGQGHEPVIQITQTPLQTVKSCPVILQRTSPDGQLQLIPLPRLDFERLQQVPRTVSGTSSESDPKGLVNIQPKPAFLNVQEVVQPGHTNPASQLDINPVYNVGNSQQQTNGTRNSVMQQEASPSSLTNQPAYNEKTSQYPNGAQGTSPQDVGHMYPASAVDDVSMNQSVNSFSTEVQMDDQSRVPAADDYGSQEGLQDAELAVNDTVSEQETLQQEGEKDHYVFCIDCRKLCKDSCDFHTNAEYKFVADTVILSRARASLPSVFYLHQSSTSDLGDHLGVWCKECINERTRFGPVVGVQVTMKTEQYKQQVNGFNPYQLKVEDGTTHALELENENRCNWTMFVRMAHSLLEQNCILYKQVDQFYIITTCEIKEEEELLMWFSKDLCLQLGISEDPGVVKLQQCEYCGKYFTTKKLLNSHSKVYHPQRFKYPCSFDMCGKLFSTQTRLNNHMLTHMGMKPFECTRCGKRFSDSSNVKAHMNIHTGEKKFQCEICGKTFRQKAHRDVHVITHTGEKKFKCTHCDKSFARQCDLKTHTYRHTNELQYQCTYCQKVFYKTQALKKHLKVHTGERNYMCGKCFKGFQTKYHRDRHLKICKERNGKEPSYMSLEEVAKLDSTCDAVPLKTVKPEDPLPSQSLIENESGGKITHGYYS